MRLILMLCLALLASVSRPAQAMTDCNSGTAGNVGALIRGAVTSINLMIHHDKAQTDLYRLFSRAAPIGDVAKLSLASAAIVVLNCAALERNNPEAAAMRTRLAAAIHVDIRNLTAARVQRYYVRRLRYAPIEQRTLLSREEQQMWVALLTLAAELHPSYARHFLALIDQASLRGDPA